MKSDALDVLYLDKIPEDQRDAFLNQVEYLKGIYKPFIENLICLYKNKHELEFPATADKTSAEVKEEVLAFIEKEQDRIMNYNINKIICLTNGNIIQQTQGPGTNT